jgi:hypothetical protein
MFLSRVLAHLILGLGDGRRRCIWRVYLTRSVLFALILYLVGPLALAHAAPPDPIWINGIYDGADHDDLITLLTDAAGLPDTRALAVARLLLLPLFTLRSLGAGFVRPDTLLLGFRLRSPPTT